MGVSLSLHQGDLLADWRRCGLSADYVAGYLALGESPALANELSTVVNEMIECTVKFAMPVRQMVSLHAGWWGRTVIVETTQWSRPDQARRLREWVQRLGIEDAETLYLEHLERTTAADTHVSGLGLVTLVRDYAARLGLRESEGTDPSSGAPLVRVTLQAHVTVG